MQIFLWIFLGLLIVFLLFFEELYRYIFCRDSSALFERFASSKGHSPEYYVYRKKGADQLRSLPHRDYTMTAGDGVKLRGFYYENGSQGKTVAFIVHGYRSDHADTGGIAFDYYRSRGIDVFAPDHRASGESGGRFIGFDVLEARDCLQWIDFLRETLEPDVQIILHGFSMGGATVMQMSSHCSENVKFIVEDSGYRNARAALSHQVGPMYGPLGLLNRLIAGYDLNDSDVTESLRNSQIPMLFFHGQQDKLVPFENGPYLYDLYSGPKDCLFPENTRHIECMYTNWDACAQKLDRFFAAYIK